mmetsp:Transcript_31079/g.88707  ORF Transcript_31079/g.88707 Transcript_31079/m.88707 type:complete len:355 (+) Transcript_31079:174-1238(+)
MRCAGRRSLRCRSAAGGSQWRSRGRRGTLLGCRLGLRRRRGRWALARHTALRWQAQRMRDGQLRRGWRASVLRMGVRHLRPLAARVAAGLGWPCTSPAEGGRGEDEIAGARQTSVLHPARAVRLGVGREGSDRLGEGAVPVACLAAEGDDGAGAPGEPQEGHRDQVRRGLVQRRPPGEADGRDHLRALGPERAALPPRPRAGRGAAGRAVPAQEARRGARLDVVGGERPRRVRLQALHPPGRRSQEDRGRGEEEREKARQGEGEGAGGEPGRRSSPGQAVLRAGGSLAEWRQCGAQRARARLRDHRLPLQRHPVLRDARLAAAAGGVAPLGRLQHRHHRGLGAADGQRVAGAFR